MKKRNRIISLALALIFILSAAAVLTGCNKDTNTPIKGLLAIQPEYVGETVTDTQHKFKKSDFKVIGVFENNVSAYVTDYEFEVREMSNGYYIIEFYYGGQENELYVPCEMNFFPTDRKSYEG